MDENENLHQVNTSPVGSMLKKGRNEDTSSSSSSHSGNNLLLEEPIPLPSSSLRRPRFLMAQSRLRRETVADAQTEEGVGENDCNSLVSYTRHCRSHMILRGGVENNSHDGNYSTDDDDDDDNDEEEEESKGNDNGERANQNTDHENKTNELTMDQCVSLLEPHLASFRERCGSANSATSFSSLSVSRDTNKATGSEKEKSDGVVTFNNNVVDDVPPQLLRVARFFRWRWYPIRRALLRPASQNEIEIGATYRLRLARALHARGLLAIAEVDGLAASFDGRRKNNPEIPDTGSSRKRQRDVDDLYDRVKLALSRLPSDAPDPNTAVQAVRHVRIVLLEYCLWWRERQQSNPDQPPLETLSRSERCSEKEQNCRAYVNGHSDLTPDIVSDWALTAFTGLVLTNGIDYTPGSRLRGKSDSIEALVVNILSNDSEEGGCQELSQAVHQRIQELLLPPMVDQLTNLHILSLSRFLSYMTQEQVRPFFIHSIMACARAKGGSGIASLPKLIACYLSLLNVDTGLQDFLMSWELRMRQDMQEFKMSQSLRQKLRLGSFEWSKQDAVRGLELCDVIFGAVKYLFWSHKSASSAKESK